MGDAASNPQWRSLHPATVLVEVVNKAVSLAWFIAVAVLLLVFGGEPSATEYIIAAVATLQVLAPIHSYVTLRYAVAGDSLVVRSGVLFKRLRTIGLDRVQHINLQRGVLHRLFGVVALTVETAGGGQAEARLAVVSEAEAENLRRQLIDKTGQLSTPNSELGTIGSGGSGSHVPSAELLWSASWKDLFILGATENRIAYIVGGFAAVMQTFQEFAGRRLAENVEEVVENRIDVDHITPLGAAVVVAWVVVGLLLAGTLVSIVVTFVTHYGFALRRGDGKLRRQYGLFTQHETVVPVRRVQVVRIDRPWLRRLLGYATIYVETAGSPSPEQRQQGGATPLCPIIRYSEAGRFVRLPFEDLDIDSVAWRPVSRLTIRRAFGRYTVVQLVLLLLLGAWLTWEVFYATPAALLLAYGLAVLRFQGLGYAEIGRYVLVRAGVWTRRIWVVPCSKIQSLAVVQTPFQRRFGLANLAIGTAGAGPMRQPTVFDLELPTATTIEDRLSTATHAAGEWLLDGV